VFSRCLLGTSRGDKNRPTIEERGAGSKGEMGRIEEDRRGKKDHQIQTSKQTRSNEGEKKKRRETKKKKEIGAKSKIVR